MRELLLPLFVVFLSSVDSLRICTRRHFQVVDSHFFQRVHLPLPELCVERCIEHLVYCKAAQFTSFQNRTNGICELHSINSGSRPGSLHPDANLDPLITVYEIMEACPTFVASDMGEKISETMKEALEKDPVHLIEERKADASLEETDRLLGGEDSVQYRRNEGYALMRTLEDDPKNPFEPEEDRHTGRPHIPVASSFSPPPPSASSPPLSSNDLLPPPISPALILHQGRCSGPNCPMDASSAIQSRDLGRTYITHNEDPAPSRASSASSSDAYAVPQHDRSPCPARQGDPCAPKPCTHRGCFQSDPAPQRYEAPPPGRWTDWSPCSVSCGDGMRTRQCIGGSGCAGPATLPCITPCPVWTPWAPWTLCSASCGEGERRRSRICLGGRCEGPAQEMERCATAPCPEWSGWGEWEGCSVSCGTGRERRLRRCENGLSCRGPPLEDRVCTLPACPYLSGWSEWSQCSVSCGVGEMTRTRKCVGDGPCDRGGATEERLLCNQQRCPEWTQWTAWTACDSCAEGGKESTRIRNRVCLYEGRPHGACSGPAQDQSPCPQSECPRWTEWGDWSDCSQPCGQGQQKRRRECRLGEQASGQCRGPGEELRFCQVAVCPYWREWSEWSGCSVTCGRGVCTRARKCVTDELLDIPNLAELEAAVAQDEELSRMAEKGGWRASAKAQLIARAKRILHGTKGKSYAEGLFPDLPSTEKQLDEAAAMCDGPATESKSCDPGPCCGWREWGEWERCDGCTPGALQRRSRQCSALSFSPDQPLISASQDAYQTPQLGSQTDPAISVHPIFRVSHPPNHPNIITAGGGPFDVNGLTPIIPINDPRFSHHHLSKRHSNYGREECECSGAREETRPCSLTCPQRREGACAWTEWSEWCGCLPCRAGRETRRRLCERPDGRTEGCRCEGGENEDRPCPMCTPHTEASSHRLDQYVPLSTGVIVSSPVQSRYQTESRYGHQEATAYVQPPKVNPPHQIEVESSTARDYVDYSERPDDSSLYKARPREFPEYAVSRRAAVSSPPTTTPSLECRWSRWSGWSDCHANRLKQRSRFCIGGGDPVSSCECSGLSVEETACEPEREHSQVEFAVRDGREEEGSGNIQEMDKCEWTPWSQWSDCSVSCGRGERIRRKRCPCGPNLCGGGITLESDLCERAACPSSDEPIRRSPKSLPVFG